MSKLKPAPALRVQYVYYIDDGVPISQSSTSPVNFNFLTLGTLRCSSGCRRVTIPASALILLLLEAPPGSTMRAFVVYTSCALAAALSFNVDLTGERSLLHVAYVPSGLPPRITELNAALQPNKRTSAYPK